MSTVSNDFLAKMPILDDCRAIVELEAASGFLKTLLRASSVADDSSEIQGAVQKLLVENERVRLLLAQHGLNYERLRTSLCGMPRPRSPFSPLTPRPRQTGVHRHRQRCRPPRRLLPVPR